MNHKKLKGLLNNEQLLQELLNREELSDSQKAANMLHQLEAEINPKAAHTETSSVNGVEVEDADGAVRIMKIGRNDLCPCGSGKKYKKCCGR